MYLALKRHRAVAYCGLLHVEGDIGAVVRFGDEVDMDGCQGKSPGLAFLFDGHQRSHVADPQVFEPGRDRHVIDMTDEVGLADAG